MSSYKLDCRNYLGDDECGRCKVSGLIFDCPMCCSEYIDYVGKKPYADQTAIEKYLKGEDT